MQYGTMKLFCLILVTLLLTSGMGFSAYSQGTSYLPEGLSSKETDILQESSIFLETKTLQKTSTLQETIAFQDSVIIKLADNRLIIENLPNDDILEVYNIMGVKVYNRRIKAGTNEYVLSIPKGYYILKIGKLTKKISIR